MSGKKQSKGIDDTKKLIDLVREAVSAGNQEPLDEKPEAKKDEAIRAPQRKPSLLSKLGYAALTGVATITTIFALARGCENARLHEQNVQISKQSEENEKRWQESKKEYEGQVSYLQEKLAAEQKDHLMKLHKTNQEWEKQAESLKETLKKFESGEITAEKFMELKSRVETLDTRVQKLTQEKAELGTAKVGLEGEKARLEKILENCDKIRLGRLDPQEARPEDAAEYYYNTEGYTLFEQWKIDEAIARFQKALEKNPKYIPAQCNLGMAFYVKGDLNSASKYLQKVLSADPENVRAHIGFAFVCKKDGQFSEAIQYLESALKKKPSDEERLEIYKLLGKTHRCLEQYASAIQNLEEALKINPADIDALNSLGFTFYSKKDFGKAQEYYRKALQVDKNNSLAWHNLGFVLLEDKKLDEAINAFTKASGIDPKSPRTHTGLGLAYRAKGELEKEIEAYENETEKSRLVVNAAAGSLATPAIAFYNRKNEIVKVEFDVDSEGIKYKLEPGFYKGFADVSILQLKTAKNEAVRMRISPDGDKYKFFFILCPDGIITPVDDGEKLMKK